MKELYNSLIKQTQRKILGLGLNYIAPGSDLSKYPKTPIVFSKAWSSLVENPSQITIRGDHKVIYETELGVVIGKKCQNVSQDEALDYIGGYFLGLDLTLDYIQELKSEGKPYDLAKYADNLLPVSHFIDKNLIDPSNTDIELKINQDIVQLDNTKNMKFSIAESIAFISRYTTLNEGDLILTGTPTPTKVVQDGDYLEAKLKRGNDVIAEINVKVNYSKFE